MYKDFAIAAREVPGDLPLRQLRDYRARRPGTWFMQGAEISLEAAYAVQDEVARLRTAEGDVPAGYKIGCAGAGTTAQFGMGGPISGHLFFDEFRPNGTMLREGDFANLAVEAEMALRIGEDGKILAAFPVIELHNFVFRAARPTLAELVANNGLHAGVILPDRSWLCEPWHLAAGARLAIQLNGRELASAGPWPLSAGPQALMDWLCDHLQERGQHIAAGRFVLAGSPFHLYRVHPGDHIVVSLEGTAAAECRIAA